MGTSHGGVSSHKSEVGRKAEEIRCPESARLTSHVSVDDRFGKCRHRLLLFLARLDATEVGEQRPGFDAVPNRPRIKGRPLIPVSQSINVPQQSKLGTWNLSNPPVAATRCSRSTAARGGDRTSAP
jgi:hypothetical protein